MVGLAIVTRAFIRQRRMATATAPATETASAGRVEVGPVLHA
jgi:hypothetical protein